MNTSGRENSVTLASFCHENPLNRRLAACPPPRWLRPDHADLSFVVCIIISLVKIEFSQQFKETIAPCTILYISTIVGVYALFSTLS